MSNITVGQIIMDAQRMASRVKDLDALGSALLVEAEGNNRLVESLRQFQDDMESLNRISNNKSNSEMVNRIQQQNANSTEILKENRELKICIEDYERAMELIMQKYREHTNSKILDSKISFRDVYNDKLWKIIREQREKINEMAAVMQRAASADDSAFNRDIELMARLRYENHTLRELLQISAKFGSTPLQFGHLKFNEMHLREMGVQTDADDSADELSLSGASIENANNSSVIQVTGTTVDDITSAESEVAAVSADTAAANTAAVAAASDTAAAAATMNNAPKLHAFAEDNNNGPVKPPTTPSPATAIKVATTAAAKVTAPSKSKADITSKSINCTDHPPSAVATAAAETTAASIAAAANVVEKVIEKRVVKPKASGT